MYFVRQNVHDNHTNLEVFRFMKNTKIEISLEWSAILSTVERIHQWHIKCYIIAKK